MKEYETFHADTLAQWRGWLEKNHASAKEIWLVLSKKASGLPSVGDAEAAEEALCFGWIDSIIRGIDEKSYMKKFTPRTNAAKWSALNVSRVKKLIAEGRMREAGRAVIPDEVLAEGYVPYTENRKEPPGEEEFLRLLEGYPKALEKFRDFPPSARRIYILWVTDAKREETRRKRAEEAAGMIERDVKSFMK
jgi:uncharacterized protein YdeI (YjbR/CyaY-like superfamily)